MKIFIKGRQHLRLPLLVGRGQLSLYSNQFAGDCHFCLGVASCVSCLGKLQDFLTNSITGKNQSVSLIFFFFEWR